MHFEILVEDRSGKEALDILVPKIIPYPNTPRVIAYRGVGRIPKNMRDAKNASRRILLENLPKLLKGYGRTDADEGSTYAQAVIVVCDLDDKCLRLFRQDLLSILEQCHPRPTARFCIAVEEGEAWLLGDVEAVLAAYPNARESVLEGYVNDSICGTWELLADAIYPGGAPALSKQGWHAVGTEKSRWARAIAPYIDVTRNVSPSFCYFRDKLIQLAGSAEPS